MATNAGAVIMQFSAAMTAASDPRACTRIFREVLAPFDIDTFACGEVDIAIRERCVFFVVEWPDDWRRFYMGSKFVERDPLLDELKRRRVPFTWSELRADRRLSKLGREALQQTADNGWAEGLAVPIGRDENRFGIVSLVSRRDRFTAETKSLLGVLSLCFHERVRALVPKFGFAVPPAGLSKREIDCLRLIAHGETDAGIGKALGISPDTAHEYVESAKRKLKTSTRAEAIAIAVSLSIIGP